MTPEAIAAAYIANRDRIIAIEAELTQRNEEVRPINQQIGRLGAEMSKLHAEQKRLRGEFAEITGGADLRRYARSPVEVAFDSAVNDLLTALDEPNSLHPSDPVVVRRIEALRNAIRARRQEMDASRGVTPTERKT